MLPLSLLDTVSLRLSNRLNVAFIIAQTGGSIRRVQHLSVQQPERVANDLPSIQRSGGLSKRDSYSLKGQQTQDRVQAVSELENRVTALKEASDASMQAAQAQLEGPHFPEAALQDIYKDLLAYPEPTTHTPAEMVANSEQVQNILQILEERLPDFEAAVREQATSSEGLSARLQARMPRASSPSASQNVQTDDQSEVFTELLAWAKVSPIRELVRRLRLVLESARPSWPNVESDDTSEIRPAPFRLLSSAEWHALSQACLDADDAYAADAVLELMKRVGLSPSEEQSDAVLDSWASKGLVNEADAHVASQGLDVPRERQRDLLVKSRVKAQLLDDACKLLHTFETRTIPAPTKSYTRVIQELLHERGPGSAQQMAQAWDLFAHMRYVAHPRPDAFLYSTMIRAAPEPQRALDLFTEMTVEQGMVPDHFAYTAIIRACARSKEFALQAFRFAREMLNSHRDAHGEIPTSLRPNNHTFCALMEAARKIGDLARARWILAQMVHASRQVTDGDEQQVYVNEAALKHMFKAYAWFRPPFRRGAAPIVRETKPPEVHPTEGAASEARDVEAAELRSTRGMPQTSQEVIHEATILWNRILEDLQAVEQGEGKTLEHPPTFGRVELSPSLLASYIQVYYSHSPPSVAYDVYKTLFENHGVERHPASYVLALEAYTFKLLSPPERRFALSTARTIWKEWCEIEAASASDASDAPKVGARLVQRAWSAMIRMLTLANKTTEAADLLHRFVERYPPENIKQPAPADPRRSNRTQLYAERPLVRLMEPSAVPEDRISPFLTFSDITLLHNRALEAREMGLVNYVKWATSAYEGALRHRRDAQLHSR